MRRDLQALAAMRCMSIQNDPNAVFWVLVFWVLVFWVLAIKFLQEGCDCLCINRWHIRTNTLTGAGFSRHQKPQPLIAILHNPLGAIPAGTPATAIMSLQSKTRLIIAENTLNAVIVKQPRKLIF